ncbi:MULTISPECIES: hypothetical protein [unclassified Microbulbifer]|uniref:hypothetical protein n=1 Tax=unclassified Microbulbifer TaxID=2619833 RepID=UPI0027E5A764|nr:MULTISPECIES: hypothetical protein [unclassified Microbulbifer]
MHHSAQSQPDTIFSPRLALSLLIATLLHIALLSLPLALPSKTEPANNSIQITIVHNNHKATGLTAAPYKNDKTETAADTTASSKVDSSTGPAKENKPDKLNHPPSRPDATAAAPATSNKNEAITKTTQQLPTTDGAKERSTVFDPRLAKKLARERNKVRKFKSRDTEFMTANGTFVQNGNTCAEIRELVPLDIDSNVSQSFKIKCTKRRRSQEDIDRLARKYGIP